MQFNNVQVPRPVCLYIFSFLNAQELGRMAQCCKKGQTLTNDDSLWKQLFKRIYHRELPEQMSGKEATERRMTVKDCSSNEIKKIYTLFLCNQGWDQTRQLEIDLSPGSIVVKEVFGPGKANGTALAKEPDQLQLYKCIDKDQRERELRKSHYKKDEIVPPISLEVTSHATNERFPDSSVRLPFGHPYTGGVCREVKIPLSVVDVGLGNRLAYYSGINDWEKPFYLFCIEKEDQKNWEGRIPIDYDFKFVKIDSEGKVTWENRNLNRWHYYGKYLVSIEDIKFG